MAKQSNRIDNLLASVTADLLNGDPQQFQDNSIRVERILLDLVRPDPVQPRRVLPERIHFAFHENQLTPTQALRELVQIVQVAARQQGRPFSGVLELLPNADADDQSEISDVKLSPEEQLLRDLVNLAVTIRDDGQVNPLTVVDVSQGVTRLYRIETGERRYWATWLLRDFIPGYDGDGMIPCIVVPADRTSVFRQAKENTSRTGLNAIAMARQAALLLLSVHGYDIPDYPVSHDFYRQVIDLDLRGKREFTDAILAAMGGIDRKRFSHYKSLLALSDEAIELADRYNIDEFRLRPVLSLPSNVQAEMVQHIIKFSLTGRQVAEMCTKGLDESTESSGGATGPQIRRFVKSIKQLAEHDEDEFVRGLLQEEKSGPMARARIDATIEFLQRVKNRLLEE
jgi:ParB-like chromosome segregation protein Spo0J